MTESASLSAPSTRYFGAALAAAAALVAAGCGSAAKHSATGSSSTASARTAAATTGTTTTGTTGTTTTGTTTASRESVRQIVADAIAAAKTIHSYRVQASVSDATGHFSALLEVDGPTRLRVVEKRSSGVLAMVIYGPYMYIKAPVAYWRAQRNITSAQAAALGGRWLRVPTAGNAKLVAGAAKLADVPKLTHCWTAHEADLTVIGSGTLNGRPVVILRSSGTEPGTAPGTTYVSTADPKLPLKSVVTGPFKPGGTPDCTGTQTSSTETIDYNQHVQIAPPRGAIALP